ncbi:uncharacterized protein LOC106640139 [Copidosoma floridanum]|uniref:uncharacterized protein LOC106640139 n=1 Tax=Copidosoma floridanum TaxID=29053 RepID=UPI0006C9DCA9|nr:uncharacterized protein LOC106640139 [Copidosoma floridanum]
MGITYSHHKESVYGGNVMNKEIDRAKLVRERQSEERVRKLEELRQQALAAQRFRNQRDEERRKRIEELRSRDIDRRCQVEERKRQIYEADQERREAIIRKNQAREARIEAKRKNERSHIVFAFGSSTPRMLEPGDTGGTGASFWGTRRATSTSNVMMSLFTSSSSGLQPLTRRSSERELDAGSKKRAISASGLDRKPGEGNDSELYFSAGGVGLTTSASSSFSSGDSVSRHVNRRRTDLMPTLPSPRDSSKEYPSVSSGRTFSAKSFNHSSGRTHSMSRLDQLAQPNRRPIAQQHSQSSQQHQQQDIVALSMSRSMSHLAAAHGIRGALETLLRAENSRSMGTLPGSGLGLLTPTPRTTKAEQLKRKALRHQIHLQQSQQQQQLNNSGFRSGEVTPSSFSRPQSAMSQLSGINSISNVVSGIGSTIGVSLRPRSIGAPRRRRPASIAGTGVSSSPTTTSNNISGDLRAQKEAKPPLPRLNTSSSSSSSFASKKQQITTMALQTSTVIKSTTSDRKFLGVGLRSNRLSLHSTPKPSPLPSPGIEQLPTPQLELTKFNTIHKQQQSIQTTENEFKHKLLVTDDCKPQVVQQSNIGSITLNSSMEETELAANESRNPESTTSEIFLSSDPVIVMPTMFTPTEDHAEVIVPLEQQFASLVGSVDKKEEFDLAKLEADFEEQCDMTASMIQKFRIMTEEEAKAALAERRRLAREQAEREAEVERQRLEKLASLEAERFRAEEEEQRRLEEETLRLVQEAREAEEQRLKQAIEEARRREEEDKKRREEEARQKAEKEEAERKAKIEAEKYVSGRVNCDYCLCTTQHSVPTLGICTYWDISGQILVSVLVYTIRVWGTKSLNSYVLMRWYLYHLGLDLSPTQYPVRRESVDATPRCFSIGLVTRSSICPCLGSQAHYMLCSQLYTMSQHITVDWPPLLCYLSVNRYTGSCRSHTHTAHINSKDAAASHTGERKLPKRLSPLTIGDKGSVTCLYILPVYHLTMCPCLR